MTRQVKHTIIGPWANTRKEHDMREAGMAGKECDGLAERLIVALDSVGHIAIPGLRSSDVEYMAVKSALRRIASTHPTKARLREGTLYIEDMRSRALEDRLADHRERYIDYLQALQHVISEPGEPIYHRPAGHCIDVTSRHSGPLRTWTSPLWDIATRRPYMLPPLRPGMLHVEDVEED